MKKYLLSFLSLFICIVSSAQTARISLEHNGTTTIYTALQAAYNAAVNDDVIILPGGNLTIADSIKKRIKILGAGICPDSSAVTGVTFISSGIKIGTGANRAQFEGIIFSGSNYISGFSHPSLMNYFGDSVVFNKCKFNYGLSSYKTIIVKDCVLLGLGSLNSLVTNCIIYSFPSGISGGIGFDQTQINNCIILNNLSANFCQIQNCILISPTISGCSNNILNPLSIGSIIFVNSNSYCNSNPPYSSNLVSGAIVVNSITDIFTTNVNTTWSCTLDYHLKSTCPGKNAGVDGTDIGIYGTAFPCSEGWVPSNPHIMFKNVSSTNTSDGKLNVNFKVRKGN